MATVRITPYLPPKGNDSERLGKLMAFIDQLENYRNKLLRANLQLADWQTLILELLEAFYAPQENEIYATQSIRQALEQWQMIRNWPIIPSRLRRWWCRRGLTIILASKRAGSAFGRPSKFLQPHADALHSFKALCMLGMNDSDYPRRTTPWVLI